MKRELLAYRAPKIQREYLGELPRSKRQSVGCDPEVGWIERGTELA